MLVEILFWTFSAVLTGAALGVILSRNPVHSVLWLILSFISSAGLFVLLGAEFVAMLLIIVYVGAVAVLFLFVVMMLDVDFSELRAEMAICIWPVMIVCLWARGFPTTVLLCCRLCTRPKLLILKAYQKM